MKKLFFLAVILAIIFSMFSDVFAPMSEDVTYKGMPRIEVPCESPKFEVHREEKINSPATLGARWANGCNIPPLIVHNTGIQNACPIGTRPLFTSPMTITEGMTLDNGIRIVGIKGNWIVEERDGVLLLTGGRKITILFPVDTYIDSMVVFDHDPKQGESGWTLDGKNIPHTLKRSYGELYLIQSFEGQLNFDNGGDSPHFNICL
jgi:hypothetical protein